MPTQAMGDKDEKKCKSEIEVEGIAGQVKREEAAVVSESEDDEMPPLEECTESDVWIPFVTYLPVIDFQEAFWCLPLREISKL